MENIAANSSVSGNPSPSESGGEAGTVPKLLADNYDNHSNQNKSEMKIGSNILKLSFVYFYYSIFF